MDILRRMMNKIDLCDHGLTCVDCCWLWTAGLDGSGYPKVWYEGRYWNACKLLFSLLHHIPLTSRYYACHTCDIRKCCNWSHLYQGTAATNGYDRTGRGMVRRKLTWSDVDTLRTLYAQGQPPSYLLRLYPQIKQSQFWRIVNNQQWVRKDQS